MSEMVKALKVFTSRGETLVTEAHENACAEGEEIASVEVVVPKGTLCSICEEEITDEP